MDDKLTVPSRKLLQRILEEPELVRVVQSLPPRALLSLIDRIGLEDAGEIVALATVPQLERMFDEDLWRSSGPSADERFEPRRFVLWLEVMLEAGEAVLADKLAELPEDLLALAFSELVLVIDLDEVTLSAIDEELEKVLEEGPYLEVGPHRAIARRPDGFDAVSAALTALDERHPDVLGRLLERLARADSEWIRYNGGLYEVLTAKEMMEADAAGDREERRAGAGHVAPASARAFLQLPAAAVETILSEPRDAITRAYFREYRDEDFDAPAAAAPSWVNELAGEASSRSSNAPLRLGGDAPTQETLLERTLAELAPDVRAERLRELAYLANVLLAGDARRRRPLEAAKEVLAVCNAGLVRAARARRPVDILASTGCEKLFRVGRLPG